MTFSIVAREPQTGLFGVAVASRFFAVGALCPHAAGDVGALSTQALINPTYGPRGLALLHEGKSPQEVVAALVGADEGRASRQLHVVDVEGASAAHTGAECVEWAGHLLGDGVSVAGNMLAGPSVIADMLAAYRQRYDLPLVERLLTAMDAAEAAGGDKRGRQSAALLVQGPEAYPRLSMRVDDHTEPLVELRRLYAVAQERFIPFSRAFPTAENPHGIHDRAEVDAMIEAAQKPAARSP
ncbi:MAG: DUF1028 domain-containing protein [Inquilinus sp.]|nr:DUF1028 domain-containing protein [Inquilinus sp.]